MSGPCFQRPGGRASRHRLELEAKKKQGNHRSDSDACPVVYLGRINEPDQVRPRVLGDIDLNVVNRDVIVPGRVQDPTPIDIAPQTVSGSFGGPLAFDTGGHVG